MRTWHAHDTALIITTTASRSATLTTTLTATTLTATTTATTLSTSIATTTSSGLAHRAADAAVEDLDDLLVRAELAVPREERVVDRAATASVAQGVRAGGGV